ncbi:MAG: universal stress protein [Candidatus Hydrogenedentota bacterium]
MIYTGTYRDVNHREGRAVFKNLKILVPTDFSHYALFATKYAEAFAKTYGGEIHFAHVLDAALFTQGTGQGLWLNKTDADQLMASMRENAESRLQHLVDMATAEGIPAHHHIVLGSPAHELLSLIETIGTTFVVIATHGRTGVEHFVFGSVAERIVRSSPVPVLTVKHPEHEFVDDPTLTPQVKRLMFPTDFSEFSMKAMPYAQAMCRQFGATLLLFHASEVPVVLPEFLPESSASVGADMESHAKEVLERMAHSIKDVNVEFDVTTGAPHREICHAVSARNIDLVVIPTHGRTGIVHALFGSTAERVVRLAPCPVLTIRPEWKA